MKKNILYIHGYGSKGNSRTATVLQDELGELYNVYSPPFSNDVHFYSETLLNIDKAKSFIKGQSIDLVIASSMGAFVTLRLSDIPKIVINPCMLASVEIPRILYPSMEAEEIDKYKVDEKNFSVTEQDKLLTYALFADNDELFSYRNYFEQLYGSDHLYSIVDGHRISEENIRNVLAPLVKDLLK